MRKIKQSTTKNVMILMVDSTDHVSGKIGLTLTITASKNGAAFASITPTVTDRGNGWYNLALTTSHTDTLGDLALHITGAAADPSDMVLLVEAGATDADVTSRMATFTYTAPDNATIGTIQADTNDIQARLPAALVSGRIDASTGAMAANVITAAAINASALNGKGDWNVGKTGYSLTQTFPANFSSLTITVGGAITAGTVSDKTGYNVSSINAGLVNATVAPNLDAAISSRMATFTYTAPDNATIAGIQADTNDIQTRLPAALVGGKIDANTETISAGAIAGIQSGLATAGNLATVASYIDTEIGAIQAKTNNIPASPASVGDIPSAATIASQVRTELAAELLRIDATISSRLAAADYGAGSAPSVEAIAAEIRSELAVELARLDATISSRLASASYTAAPSAEDVMSTIRTSTNTTPIRANAVQINDVNLAGDGTVGNPMRGT